MTRATMRGHDGEELLSSLNIEEILWLYGGKVVSHVLMVQLQISTGFFQRAPNLQVRSIKTVLLKREN